MIKKYIKNNKTYYMVNNLYLGKNPITGKEVRKSKKGFSTKREAQLYVNKLKSSFDNGEFILQPEKTTFIELYNLFLDYYKKSGVKDSTYYCFKSTIKDFVEEFQNIDISKIHFKHIQTYVNNIYSEYKYATIFKKLTWIKLIFRYAVRTELLKESPVDKVILPRKPIEIIDEDTLYYTKEELEIFFNLIEEGNSPQILALFRLLAFTGARVGEITALQWSDIDFNNNLLTINKTLALTVNGLSVQTPKNSKSIRKINLDTNTLKILKKHKINQAKNFMKSGKRNTNNVIFLTDKLKYFRNTKIREIYRAICENNNFKIIKVHGFRHTHCSLLFEAGASIQEVQYRLGHSDIKTTMNIYNHITKKQKEATADKFARYVNF